MDLDTQDKQWAKADDLWKGQSNTTNRCPETPSSPNIAGEEEKNPRENPYAEALADTKIIWAEVPRQELEGEHKDEPVLYFTPVLGGKPEEVGKTRRVGVVLFPQDVDGVVRRLVPRYKLKALDSNLHSEVVVPSFYKSVSDLADEDSLAAPVIAPFSRPQDGSIIRWLDRSLDWICQRVHQGFCPAAAKDYFYFSRDRYSFQPVQASEFLNATPEVRERLAGVMSGHVVLIGGNYTAARDEYWTPFGKMAGVELIANAIESEWRGHIHSVRTRYLWLIDLFAGTLIVFFYYRWRAYPGIALVASCLAILTAFVAAWGFYQWALWLNVAPVMGGMVIHEMCESSVASCESSVASAEPP
jgi:CHASE2 domain-containing sensor protein